MHFCLLYHYLRYDLKDVKPPSVQCRDQNGAAVWGNPAIGDQNCFDVPDEWLLRNPKETFLLRKKYAPRQPFGVSRRSLRRWNCFSRALLIDVCGNMILQPGAIVETSASPSPRSVASPSCVFAKLRLAPPFCWVCRINILKSFHDVIRKDFGSSGDAESSKVGAAGFPRWAVRPEQNYAPEQLGVGGASDGVVSLLVHVPCRIVMPKREGVETIVRVVVVLMVIAW